MKHPLAIALAIFAIPAQAEIFRCTSAGGAVSYQELPCAESEKARAMSIPSAYPEVNNAARNELLQREAAMDARLMRRNEIESAERIARNEIAAREREAQAARDAAAAAQGYSAIYGAWPVYRGPYVRHYNNYPIRALPLQRF